MPTNKSFLKRLQAGKASFYLVDFHVHSPASHDFKGELPTGTADEVPPPPNLDTDQVPSSPNLDALTFQNPGAKHEAEALLRYPVEAFYEAIVSHHAKIAERESVPEPEDWAIAAITDHNVCAYSARLSQYAWQSELLKKNRLVLLPGIELEVEFPVPEPPSVASAHLLLVFAPLTECHHIHAAIREASSNAWDFGTVLKVADLPKFVSAIRHHAQYPATCIAAHVGSSKGVREEAKNSILTFLEAEVSRLKGELASPNISGKKNLERQLKDYEERLAPEHIALSVLQLLGVCGFDALQTRGPRDQAFYRRLHRYREGLGRSVSIVCSDAHCIEDMFSYCDEASTERLIPYIKLSGVPCSMSAQELFQEIRDKGLRYGETRTTHVTPQYVTSWIQGVEIIRDAGDATQFWPFVRPDGSAAGGNKPGIQRFTIPLSRNLNCVIGGRGSGKSALIEAIAFLCIPKPFDEKANQKESDWYSRAKATLRGCRIRLCWRLLDSPKPDLPRSALCVQRYFDAAGKHMQATLANLDDKELLPGSITQPNVQVFRIHDIEEAAKPEKLRELFDTICGAEINTLAVGIDDVLQQLGTQREKMVGIATKIADLTKEHSPLRQFARRKREYEAVNQPEIREQYQTIRRRSCC